MKYNSKIRDSFGKQLEVLQEIPSKGDKFPTIVMVSGFGADCHEYGLFDDISDLLIRNGFQTIRFNFEGIGGSEGDFVEMTIEKQSQQVKDILKFTLKDRFTDKKKIGILTQSFGGPTVMAALPLEKVSTFLFMSAPAYPADSLARYFKRQRGYDPLGISKRERSDNRITSIGPKFWQTLTKYNFLQEVKKLTQPVLFINGTKDKNVSYSEAQLYYDAVTSKKKLHYIYHANHGFTRQFREKLLELVKDWFNQILHGQFE